MKFGNVGNVVLITFWYLLHLIIVLSTGGQLEANLVSMWGTVISET
jgi:hypothetical protein